MIQDNIAGTRSALPAMKWALARRVLDVGHWAVDDGVQPAQHDNTVANNVRLTARDMKEIVR